VNLSFKLFIMGVLFSPLKNGIKRGFRVLGRFV
jgi:hypothetical protein